VRVKVQEKDFDVGAELAALMNETPGAGAAVTFSGCVRGEDAGGAISALELEHYPAMTEKKLQEIAAKAVERFGLQNALIIHRFGKLAPGERIVLVVTLAAHREDAFEGAKLLMDYLKTEAPFWKKEITGGSERWVEAKASDDAKKKRWEK
jgi:molybdopterin synthase catalytic subunit